MNKWLYTALLVFSTFSLVKAQENIRFSYVNLSRSQETVQLQMDVSFPHGKPGKREVVLITPRLVCGNDSADLPSIGIYGRLPYYQLVRGGINPLQGADDIMLQGKPSLPVLHYVRHVDYQPWMEDATLRLMMSIVTCCDDETAERSIYSQTSSRQLQAQITTQPSTFEELTHTAGGSAYIKFKVNQTDIIEDYGNNRKELAKIRATIDSVRLDTAVHIKSLVLHGFASPEGTYDNNERLAKGRVEGLRQYIEKRMGISGDRIVTHSTPEDWAGFRKFMVAHRNSPELPHAEAIITIIDSDQDTDYDQKLDIIRNRYPQEYKYLLDNCFPLLRHTDYEINYSRNEYIEHLGASDTTYTLVGGLQTQQTISDIRQKTPKTFYPLVALKTNLLFDAALAPNGELELPLGNKSRWSLMAEYWMPWYVWHRNSRAYEIQTLGFELRYWSPRCKPCRPVLTGSFWGAYIQTGKYDLEWNSKGYQGEFTSAGITVGHSWALARHWNFEASASLGALWGPQRYYKGQFNDTHLIWQHDDHLFYVGPTKLKLSLVYLVTNYFHKKQRKEARP